MDNPWLKVPLDEYEGHMSAPSVDQLTALAEAFGSVLAARRPGSVAVLGVAGGNGLEKIDPACTGRVLGVDCNAEYLGVVRQRFAGLPGLELHCADLAAERLALEPVELVHAALVFEHAGVELCLENAIGLVRPGGALSVVLQLPSTQAQAVAATGFRSIQKLSGHFQFVDPADLRSRLQAKGFVLAEERRQPLAGGKALWCGVFVNSGDSVTAI